MISKHQRWTPDGKWIAGKVRLAANSSLRKLERSMRRGTIPSERQFLIHTATERAAQRRNAYLNSSPLKSAYVAKMAAAKAAQRAAG